MLRRAGARVLAGALIIQAVAVAGLVFWADWAPWWAWLAPLNLITLAVFAADKWAARLDIRRIPERVLLLLSLLGGSPGGELGQRLFRHKLSKRPFRLRFYGIVALQVLLVVGWFLLRGR